MASMVVNLIVSLILVSNELKLCIYYNYYYNSVFNSKMSPGIPPINYKYGFKGSLFSYPNLWAQVLQKRHNTSANIRYKRPKEFVRLAKASSFVIVQL